MKRMKLDKTCTVCMILLLTVLLAACGRGSNQEAASEKPVDIVSEVAEVVSSETETTAMDETVQKNYKVLLDGTSDQEAVYYLMDVTGNGSPELIVGKEAMSVYSCNQGAVTTIGAWPLIQPTCQRSMASWHSTTRMISMSLCSINTMVR